MRPYNETEPRKSPFSSDAEKTKTTLFSRPKAKASIIALSVVLAGSPCFVSAEESQTEASEKEDALYEEGIALFNQGRYAEAEKAFEEITKISSDFRAYFNIGECELRQKRYDLAVEAFSVYLSEEKDITKRRRDYAGAVITKMTPELGRLRFYEEETFEIWIDDKLRASTPLKEPLFVMPGERNVILKKDGEVVFSENYVVEAEETIAVKKTTPPPPPPVEETVETTPPETTEPQEESSPLTLSKPTQLQPKRSPLKPLGFALIGVGGAALLSGTITGATVLSKKNTLEDNCSKDLNCSDNDKSVHNTAENLATVTDVFLSVGGALAVTGVIVAVAGHKKTKRESNLAVAPLIDRRMSGIVFSGRF